MASIDDGGDGDNDVVNAFILPFLVSVPVATVCFDIGVYGFCDCFFLFYNRIQHFIILFVWFFEKYT